MNSPTTDATPPLRRERADVQGTRTTAWERSRTCLGLRLAAGAFVLCVGLDHFYEYRIEHYAVLPTIGKLFLLNFLGATACGLLLLAPLSRISRDLARVTWRLAAIGGLAIGITSLIGLLVSEQTPLFGYMELGYRPAVVVGLGSEAAAATLCGLLLYLDVRHARRHAPAHRPVAGRADLVRGQGCPRCSNPEPTGEPASTGRPTREQPGREVRSGDAA
jgi:hypothetical protein